MSYPVVLDPDNYRKYYSLPYSFDLPSCFPETTQIQRNIYHLEKSAQFSKLVLSKVFQIAALFYATMELMLNLMTLSFSTGVMLLTQPIRALSQTADKAFSRLDPNRIFTVAFIVEALGMVAFNYLKIAISFYPSLLLPECLPAIDKNLGCVLEWGYLTKKLANYKLEIKEIRNVYEANKDKNLENESLENISATLDLLKQNLANLQRIKEQIYQLKNDLKHLDNVGKALCESEVITIKSLEKALKDLILRYCDNKNVKSIHDHYQAYLNLFNQLKIPHIVEVDQLITFQEKTLADYRDKFESFKQTVAKSIADISNPVIKESIQLESTKFIAKLSWENLALEFKRNVLKLRLSSIGDKALKIIGETHPNLVAKAEDVFLEDSELYSEIASLEESIISLKEEIAACLKDPVISLEESQELLRVEDSLRSLYIQMCRPSICGNNALPRISEGALNKDVQQYHSSLANLVQHYDALQKAILDFSDNDLLSKEKIKVFEEKVKDYGKLYHSIMLKCGKIERRLNVGWFNRPKALLNALKANYEILKAKSPNSLTHAINERMALVVSKDFVVALNNTKSAFQEVSRNAQRQLEQLGNRFNKEDLSRLREVLKDCFAPMQEHLQKSSDLLCKLQERYPKLKGALSRYEVEIQQMSYAAFIRLFPSLEHLLIKDMPAIDRLKLNKTALEQFVVIVAVPEAPKESLPSKLFETLIKEVEGEIPEKIYDEGTYHTREELIKKLKGRLLSLDSGQLIDFLEKTASQEIGEKARNIANLIALGLINRKKEIDAEKDLQKRKLLQQKYFGDVKTVVIQLGVSFFHCQDNVTNSLQRLYFKYVEKDPAHIAKYLEQESLTNKVIHRFLLIRRGFFEQAIESLPLEDRHANDTERFLKKKFNVKHRFYFPDVIHEENNNYEGLARKSYDKIVEKDYEKRLQAQPVLREFANTIKDEKTKDVTFKLVWNWFLANFLFDESELLNETLTELNDPAIAYFLLKHGLFAIS